MPKNGGIAVRRRRRVGDKGEAVRGRRPFKGRRAARRACPELTGKTLRGISYLRALPVRYIQEVPSKLEGGRGRFERRTAQGIEQGAVVSNREIRGAIGGRCRAQVHLHTTGIKGDRPEQAIRGDPRVEIMDLMRVRR